MNKCLLFGVITIAVHLLCLSPLVHGQDDDRRNAFFSADRFFIPTQILDAVTNRPDSRADLKKFSKYFSDGIYALSEGKYRTARNRFYKARRIWPEYFGTDFLIAISFEQSGNIRQAARFYKGYLDKLNDLEAGRYPISQPLIRGLNKYAEDNYEGSKALIEEHLKGLGIDLSEVAAPFFIPDFVKILFFIFLLAIAGVVTRYTVIPYITERSLDKSVPEGYWRCKKCGELNPVLAKECVKCVLGKKRFQE